MMYLITEDGSSTAATRRHTSRSHGPRMTEGFLLQISRIRESSVSFPIDDFRQTRQRPMDGKSSCSIRYAKLPRDRSFQTLKNMFNEHKTI